MTRMKPRERQHQRERAEAIARAQHPDADEITAWFYGSEIMVAVWRDGAAVVHALDEGAVADEAATDEKEATREAELAGRRSAAARKAVATRKRREREEVAA